MNLKKFFVAFVLLATTAVAGAQNSNNTEKKYALSWYPLTEMSEGIHDAEIVNSSNMTGKQVREILDAYTKKFAGVSLKEFVELTTLDTIKSPHYNSQAIFGTIQQYFDATPTGYKRTLRGASIKENCSNLLSENGNQIKDFLKEYFNRGNGQTSDKLKTGDDQPDQKENNKKDTTIMNLTQNFTSGAPETTSSTPWGWIIGILAIIALIVIGAIVIMSILNNRRNTHREMLDERNSNINSHYNEVNKFLQTARQMNVDAAYNANTVHSAWKTINSPNNQGSHT